MPTTATTEISNKRSVASEERRLWERAEGESAKAFEAFSFYRDLPLEYRSLAAAAQQLRKSKSLCARWSTRYQWVRRATTWEDQQSELRRKRRAAEREKALDRQLQQTQLAAQALMSPLLALA